MMLRFGMWAATAAAAIFCSGCVATPSSGPSSGSVATTAVSRGGRALACALGGAVLPVTRLCQEQAEALLLSAGGDQEAAPDGCIWVVNEARMLGNGALLYRGLRCGSRTTRLEFTPSARAGTFDLVESPFGDLESPETIATMFNADRRDPSSAILEAARRVIDDPAERRRCQVRRLNGDVASPSDALVVDEVPVPQSEEVRSACGPFGFDGGSQAFWRVSQKIAWFFSLGNDSPPVDPTSFTLVRRNAAGRWVRS